MKGDILRSFATDWIVSMEDITDFVLEQAAFVRKNDMGHLTVIQETCIDLQNPRTIQKLKIGAEM